MSILKIWDGSSFIEIPLVRDHGGLLGLGDDDHPQYILATGVRGFSSTVSGIDPTEAAHLATKNYVENAAVRTLTVQKVTSAEDISFFYTPVERTVDQLIPTIAGATASGTTWTVRHDSDRQAVGTEVVVGGTNTHSGTGGNSGTPIVAFNNPIIPATSFVWLETTTASGIIDEFSLTLV